MTPNRRRMENLPALAREFRADGVLDIGLQACHTYLVESFDVRALCKQHGLPFMSLETDYSSADQGQIDTRIAAFLETLDQGAQAL